MVTEWNKPRRINIQCVVFGAIPQMIMCWMCDEVTAIISFVVNLMLWHDMTFMDPEMYEPQIKVILQHQYL